MPLSVSDILHNADLFRRAYPDRPHPAPEETTMREVPALGDPCPNGCVTGLPGREQPVLLVEGCPGSGDGEITCMACWDAWNELEAGR